MAGDFHRDAFRDAGSHEIARTASAKVTDQEPSKAGRLRRLVPGGAKFADALSGPVEDRRALQAARCSLL